MGTAKHWAQDPLWASLSRTGEGRTLVVKTGIVHKAASTELAGEKLETVQDTLRFVRSLSDPQAEAIARQLKRLMEMEMALRKLVAAADDCITNMGRPMTLHVRYWCALRAALAEGRARLKG